MTDLDAFARRIEMTGWSTVVLGLVCVLLALIQAVAPVVLRRIGRRARRRR